MLKKIALAVWKYIRSTDRWLFLILFAICGLDLLILSGVANTFAGLDTIVSVQALAMIIGLAVIVVLSTMDYHTIARLWKLYLPFVLALVGLTFVIGAQRGGADDRAWLLLPGGMSLQPSEFLKIAFILTFGLHLQGVHEKINRPLHLLLLCAHGAFPVLLIHIQGDDGSALVFLFLFLVMLFCAGVSWWYIGIGLVGVAAILPVIWSYVLTPDQQLRILSLFNPGSDPLGIEMQQSSAQMSIALGRVWGRGIFAGDHNYVPEIQNDFVFSFIGESLGFVGCAVVFAILMALCLRILYVAHRSSDLLGKLICVGVFTMLCVQTILNIGMNISVLPVIGVTLPFFSAGGSSIITLMAGMGLVFSVYQHNEPGMFEAPKKPDR